jgi:sugar phosphate isomerase/epimerase
LPLLQKIEYVSQFFKDKAKDKGYLGEMKKRAADNGVKSLIIMVDGEGDLGGLDAKKRKAAVANHEKWLEAAQLLGCHSIRVNAFGVGSREEVSQAAIDGLGSLAEMGAKYGQNVIVENHGGWSSDGDWLTNVMAQVNMPNCGILPDFGNFCIERKDGKQWDGECLNEYDRYKGVQQFMKYAKAVSAKSHDFNEAGEETKTDYLKMMKIVKDAGYRGYVGVEYEGSVLSEMDGIMATKKLLETVGKKLS